MIVLARLYSSLVTEERFHGEFSDFSDIQVGNPEWWAYSLLLPSRVSQMKKNSSSKYLIRVVETIGAQAAAKNYQVRCFMLTIFSRISC